MFREVLRADQPMQRPAEKGRAYGGRDDQRQVGRVGQEHRRAIEEYRVAQQAAADGREQRDHEHADDVEAPLDGHDGAADRPGEGGDVVEQDGNLEIRSGHVPGWPEESGPRKQNAPVPADPCGGGKNMKTQRRVLALAAGWLSSLVIRAAEPVVTTEFLVENLKTHELTRVTTAHMDEFVCIQIRGLLTPDGDHPFQLTVYDGLGREVTSTRSTITAENLGWRRKE